MGSYRRAFDTTTQQVLTMKSLLLVCVFAALSQAVPLPIEEDHHHGHHGHHGSLASKLHHKNEEHHNLASKLLLASKLHHKNEHHHEEEDHHEDEHHEDEHHEDEHHEDEHHD